MGQNENFIFKLETKSEEGVNNYNKKFQILIAFKNFLGSQRIKSLAK